MFAVKERKIYMPKIPYSKRPYGRYYKQIVIGFDTSGKRKVKTLYDKDWRKLDKKVKEFCVNAEQGVFVRDDITLEECVNLWLRTKQDIRPATMHNYKRLLKYLNPIQHILLKNLKLMHIQTIYEEMRKIGIIDSIWSLNSLLKSIFNYAIDYTGMRRNEILALQKKDINFTNNCINVHKTLATDKECRTIVQYQTKTAAGTRTIPMVESLKDFLVSYTEKSEEEDFLFLSSAGHLIQSGVFAYHWRCILKKINKYMPEGEVTNITSHYFRHNFTTDLVYAGVPLKTVQAIMGHENIQTTMDIYADVRYDNSDVIHKLSSYLG